MYAIHYKNLERHSFVQIAYKLPVINILIRLYTSSVSVALECLSISPLSYMTSIFLSFCPQVENGMYLKIINILFFYL